MRERVKKGDEPNFELISFLLLNWLEGSHGKKYSQLCLNCKHYKPRKGECKKIRGFLGEDFVKGNTQSEICTEYEARKD